MRPLTEYESVLTLHPAHDRRVAHGDIAFRHHSGQIAVAQLVRQVPADAEFDYLSGVATPVVNGIAGSGSRVTVWPWPLDPCLARGG